MQIKYIHVFKWHNQSPDLNLQVKLKKPDVYRCSLFNLGRTSYLAKNNAKNYPERRAAATAKDPTLCESII